MKDTKVYVDELPKNCVGCKYFAEHRRQCNLELCLQWNEAKFKFNDCPLVDIKTHDRELVKEVCEKIREHLSEQKKSLKDTFSPYSNGKAFIISTVEENLNKIEKEFEDGNINK